MSIKICDTIMGSGKSSAAINYMNQHSEQKFIYITPYLEEAARIRSACPKLHFKEPNDKLPEFGFTKYKHTINLLTSGENITSTHNMFLRYSEEMIDIIKEQEYTLIIDEAVEALRNSKIKPMDIQLLKDAGWLTKNDDEDTFKCKPTREYKDGLFKEVVALANGNRIIDMPGLEIGETYYYWIFSKEILEAFRDVYVLTYMFDVQSMRHYLDLVGLKYEYIGLSYNMRGEYFFSDENNYLPEFVGNLSSKIHIFDNDKLNAIGKNKNSLSSSWFKRYSTESDQKQTLRKNVQNFFRNYNGDKPQKMRLWATFKTGESLIRQKGFYYDNIAFNTRATNDYRDKRVLAYCVNVFMMPYEKNYLISKGIDIQEDRYALSVMLQWIWRSAIRDGKEIWIYIPSKRMRTLLKDWIEKVENDYRIMEELNSEERVSIE